MTILEMREARSVAKALAFFALVFFLLALAGVYSAAGALGRVEIPGPTTTTSSGVESTTNGSGAYPAFSFWFVSVGQASCSLVAGVCSMMIKNNGNDSSYDLALATDDCLLDLIYAHNDTVTSYTGVNGTAGGQVTQGLPFGANVTATCTVPTAQLAHEPNGWPASGHFWMKLINSLSSIPPGTKAYVEFEGTWTAPVSFSFTTGTLTFVGLHNFTCERILSNPCFLVTYRNNVNYTLYPRCWLVLRNAEGQTVKVDAILGRIGGYWNEDIGYPLFSVPAGNYTGYLFATTANGIVLSTTTQLDITIVGTVATIRLVTATSTATRTTSTTTAIPEFPGADLLFTLTMAIVVGLVLIRPNKRRSR